MDKQQLLQRLKAYGFSEQVLDAFSKVKREDFVPEELQNQAYEDTALPIGYGQTISQPYTIAVMLSELELKKAQKVLEIGSGSGYVLALLSKIVGRKGKVFGIELISGLAAKSKEVLRDYKNYKNVKVYNRNGAGGLPEKAPFDRILISAACREIPKKVLNQLKDGGILLTPKGPRFEQTLIVIKRKGNEFKTIREIPGFIFVPFIENSGKE